MEQRLVLECSSLAVGGVIAFVALRNPKTLQGGIGPHTLQALAISLLAPVVLVLGIEKILAAETIAVIVGALVGFGLPKGKD